MKNTPIGLELHSLTNLIHRYFEFSSHKKEIQRVTGNNAWIIDYLANNIEKDIFQKDIENHFSITRSTVSKVLSLMEQKELIKRESVPYDARLKKIVLTNKAMKIRKIMMEDRKKMEQTLLKGFTHKEIETLHSYLIRMKKNLSTAPENNGGNMYD